MRSFFRTQQLHYLKPAHDRHLKVQKDQVKRILFVHRSDLRRISRRHDIEISPTPKRELEQFDVRDLVINDQDSASSTISWHDHDLFSASSSASLSASMNSLTLIGFVR